MDLLSYSYIDILIGAVLVLIMFGIGLSLTPARFRLIALHPKELIIALALQMIALPLIVFAIMLPSGLPVELKIGFIILAACPGATTSGFINYLFKGNIELSISLTVISSLLALLSIPFVINLASTLFSHSTTEIHLPYLQSTAQIFLLTVIPAIAGIIFRSYRQSWVNKIQNPLKWILLALLGFVFIIKFFAGEVHGGTGIISAEFRALLPWAFFINILAFLVGFFISRVSKLNIQNAYTIGINITMQNTTLAFLVAGTLLQDQDMVKPSLVYSMFSFWTAILISIAVKKVYKTGVLKDFTA